MGELAENINQNHSILISRNTPVALVVGAAGFIGSNLVDHLLAKGNIQVIGVDNFLTGKREHLNEAVKEKRFHLMESSAQELELNIDRLDYIFIVTDREWGIDKILELAKSYQAKIALVSTIELYDNKQRHKLNSLKKAESDLAKFAAENSLNARVIRLSAVFGPRMHFRHSDPIVDLIRASLTGELQNESSVSVFSSRAIFVDDAVNLITKSILSGSTALKVFDGARLHPIKVSEIKQILMDPVWHEQRGFEAAQLPPWPTPNLEKTMQYLSWRPQTNIIKGLKETAVYFKDNDRDILKEPREDQEERREVQPETLANTKKEENLWDLKEEQKEVSYRYASKIYLILTLALIFYALVLPVVSIVYGIWDFKSNLTKSAQYLKAGEFDKSLTNIRSAQTKISQATDLIESLDFISQVRVLSNYLQLAKLATDSLQNSIQGSQLIYQGFKSVTGESADDPKILLAKAQLEFVQADEKINKVYAIMNRNGFKDSLPTVLKPQIVEVEDKLSLNRDFIKKGRVAAQILPAIVGVDSKKSYLVIVQNNAELRPTGGFIGSLAQIDFAEGRLKSLTVKDVYEADKALKIHVEPPKEIKQDLGQKDWFLRDANFDPDFPTSARQAQWFYNQETGVRVDGVIALDVAAIAKLISVVGRIELTDYNETITSDNLFEKSVAYAEAKKNFLTDLTQSLFNKLFFLPNQNWPGLVSALGSSLEEKHLMVYLDDSAMFSYVVAQNWAGVLPRQTENTASEALDFLSIVEANLGVNQANYYLDRNYHLDTVISQNGAVSHRLKINYTNRSPSSAFPAGKYKNRARIYLPFGSKLGRVLWGEKDVTRDITTFADYGRTGFSLLLELNPKESQNLVLDYQILDKVAFKDGKGLYRLDVIKQAGTDKDPFEWTLTYPVSYKLSSSLSQGSKPQEYTISTDLSKDRSFQVEFTK